MFNDAERILISEADLHKIVSRLGAEITDDYKDKNLLLVSVLKGAVVFMTDLMREIKIPCSIDFMATSSYEGAKSTGVVKIIKDLDETPKKEIDIVKIMPNELINNFNKELNGFLKNE